MAEGLDLSKSPALAGLTVSDVDELERIALMKEYAAESPVFKEGEAAFGVCIILAGSVSLRTSLGVEEVEVAQAGPGDLIGWSGLVPPHEFSATAVALEPTSIAILQSEDLVRLSEEDQYLGRILMRNVASLISQRLREAHKSSAGLVQQLRNYVPSGKALNVMSND